MTPLPPVVTAVLVCPDCNFKSADHLMMVKHLRVSHGLPMSAVVDAVKLLHKSEAASAQ